MTYFIPKVFGQKINSFNITVEIHFKNIKFDMELWEIRNEKGISEHIVKCHKEIKKKNPSYTILNWIKEILICRIFIIFLWCQESNTYRRLY